MEETKEETKPIPLTEKEKEEFRFAEKKHDDEIKLKRTEYWYSLLKVIVTIIGVNIFSGIVQLQMNNSQAQMKLFELQREEALKSAELQREYAGKFVSQALDGSIERRLQFAHYFYCLLGDQWIKYYEDLKKQKEAVKIVSAEKLQELEIKKAEMDKNPKQETPKAMAEVSVLQKEVDTLQQQITPAQMQNPIFSKLNINGWVYVGQKDIAKKGIWKERVLSFDKEVATDTAYVVLKKAFLREAKPINNIMGKSIKLMDENTKLLINEIWENSETGSVWARVNQVM